MERGGTRLWYLDQILTSVPSQVALAQATWICTSDFIGADPSSSVGDAVAQHGIRGIKSPYSDLHSSQPQPYTGYGAD